ncbi:hypothetical protein [Planomicrobium sp. CPCC 101110]|uniref:hypothetical protein n=1 Tax=Planomicrobium sp. CPCC 101110 TaxID=2599619 RepID=UPI0011B5EABE|nr:hypothetical protein [Planomicrobium sp. CPCC 101110]TWT24820.1 hypothetical protein FQV30_15105 [Planomicrobium sp. CPCC 101110]
MTQHSNEELRLINQLLLAIFLVTDFGYFLFLNHPVFPWFALAGSAVGLTIIVYCWSGTKYWLFNTILLLSTVVFSVVYNFNVIL